MTAAESKQLKAAHHRWPIKLLGISWKDKVTNEEVLRPETQAITVAGTLTQHGREPTCETNSTLAAG